MSTKKGFDPNDHLVKVKGGQLYLEVKWRLVWLREEQPDASVEVELTHLDLDGRLAVSRATVTLPNGTKATEIGSETEQDFPAGWIEKSATKAVGRALAALGFGTPFALELEEGAPADSPVARGTGAVASQAGSGVPAQAHGGRPPTPKGQAKGLSVVKPAAGGGTAPPPAATAAGWNGDRSALRKQIIEAAGKRGRRLSRWEDFVQLSSELGGPVLASDAATTAGEFASLLAVVQAQ